MQLRVTRDISSTPTETLTSAKALLVMNDRGQPIAFFLQQPDGTIFSKNATEKGFQSTLSTLGFDKEVQYEVLKCD